MNFRTQSGRGQKKELGTSSGLLPRGSRGHPFHSSGQSHLQTLQASLDVPRATSMNTSSRVWYHCPHGVPQGTTPLRSSNGADILKTPRRHTAPGEHYTGGTRLWACPRRLGVTAHAQESKLACPSVQNSPFQSPFKTLVSPGEIDRSLEMLTSKEH